LITTPVDGKEYAFTELQISGMEPVSYAQNSVNNNSICNSYIYFVIVTNNNQI